MVRDARAALLASPSRVPLGKAIQELQPNANTKAEVKKAEKEAAQDLREAKEKQETEPHEAAEMR